jgi:uncharacterized membrane protein YhhN
MGLPPCWNIARTVAGKHAAYHNIVSTEESLLGGSMVNVALIATAFGLLAGLLAAEKTKKTWIILAFKLPLSVLFLVTGLIQPHPIPSYYHWVLAGLVGGLIGDVFLALKGKRAFKAGLISFLLGHVSYIIAFAVLTQLPDWLSLGHIFIASVSLGVFWWLRPHLGSMMVPVVLYIIAITLMAAAAWSAFRNPGLNSPGAWALLLGAFCFYVSDLFVARDRFVASQFTNRLFGLPLYYAGQFLIALSVGLVR